MPSLLLANVVNAILDRDAIGLRSSFAGLVADAPIAHLPIEARQAVMTEVCLALLGDETAMSPKLSASLHMPGRRSFADGAKVVLRGLEPKPANTLSGAFRAGAQYCH